MDRRRPPNTLESRAGPTLYDRAPGVSRISPSHSFGPTTHPDRGTWCILIKPRDVVAVSLSRSAMIGFYGPARRRFLAKLDGDEWRLHHGPGDVSVCSDGSVIEDEFLNKSYV
ncbi:hypothetical protein MCOR25_001017 [Pyricularia grisea]|nr:hypothetical protein MCOR25_001017 [Pyricularia grisea]